MEGLNGQQRAAVGHGGGALAIIACPGAGKTKVLAHRVSHLITEQGIPPDRVVVATFTTKAAHEIKHRINRHLLHIGTLHSLGVKILRSCGKEFVIYTDKKCNNIIEEVIEELQLSRDILPPAYLLNRVSRFKGRLISPSEALSISKDKGEIEYIIARVYKRFQEKLAEDSAADFDDLIYRTVHLLRRYPAIREQLGIEHILIDEGQDTNPSQFEMIKLLLSPEENITMVSDPDQSIYTFQGADSKIMLNTFPNASIHPLGKNYRCSGTIVKASAGIIKHNKNRIIHDLTTDNPMGDPIVIITTMDEMEEAKRVSKEIEKLNKRSNISYNEIAVLGRTNAQLKIMKDELVKNGQEDVRVSTIHAAKGREFDVVFIVGVEEGILPHYLSLKGTPEDLEEEKRLMYVALTRARKQIYITWTRVRKIRDREIVCSPSRFIHDIPKELLERRL